MTSRALDPPSTVTNHHTFLDPSPSTVAYFMDGTLIIQPHQLYLLYQNWPTSQTSPHYLASPTLPCHRNLLKTHQVLCGSIGELEKRWRSQLQRKHSDHRPPLKSETPSGPSRKESSGGLERRLQKTMDNDTIGNNKAIVISHYLLINNSKGSMPSQLYYYYRYHESYYKDKFKDRTSNAKN